MYIHEIFVGENVIAQPAWSSGGPLFNLSCAFRVRSLSSVVFLLRDADMHSAY